LATIKEERDVVNNDYRDRLVSLLRALQQHTDATGQTVHGQALIQQRLALQNASNNGENTTGSSSNSSNSKLLTPDEATMLTIQSLTRKIERLNVETTDLTDQLARSRERNEDLESINAAQEYKIAALEKQFSSINQKRNKVVSSHILQAQAATTATATSTSVTKSVSTTAKSTTHTKSSGSSSSSYKTFVPPKLQKEKENIPPTSSSSSSQHATVSAALALIKTPTSSSSSTTEPYKKVVVVSPTDASPVSSTSSHRDTTISTESSTNLTLKERGMYAAKRPKSRLSSSTRLVKLVDQM
jgi:hypothetical protein